MHTSSKSGAVLLCLLAAGAQAQTLRWAAQTTS